ncbi:hypothetical protein PENCOP_c017G04341 [Penicillium coprophilum]|uniref:Uncharacterized protein n=1 Tax=Penicillium coprophilum TaxID=36646 RepID=A0A1V6U7U9_9EURO|nr:hypothetical protein PENCOP_c017G04341 [Penicillium coprophilum]
MSGHEAIVSNLLDKDVEETARYTDGAIKDNYNWTPREFAEINGHTGVVNIIDTNDDSNDDNATDAISVNEENWTALHCKAINNIEVHSTRKDEKWTPLQFAADNELGTAIQQLLGKGANFMANGSQPQPHGHARCGHDLKTAIRWLLQKDGNPRQIFMKEPLSWAALKCLKTVTRQLLIAGAGSESPNNGSHGESRPLHLATQSGHEKVVRLLIDAGADIDTGSWFSKTSLHCASKHGHRKFALQLLIAGADVEVQASDWQTPLHFAAEHGHDTIVRSLLNAATQALM